MIDPADQRASDEAIKRNTNLTPTGVRQALSETAVDFQRRVDAQGSTTPVDSIPKQVGQITTTQTTLKGDPITLTAQNDNQNAFPKNSTGFDNGTGTATTPYVMGTNSTTGGGAVANNDSWTRAGGPSPAGGGPYDGVATGIPVRIWELGIGNGFIIFTRGTIFDSNGGAVSISVESGQNVTSI